MYRDTNVLGNIEIQKDRELDIRDLAKMFKISNKVLIYGDVNAEKTVWNCRNNNPNGKMLLEYTMRQLYEVIFPDTFTLYPYNDGLPSTVDIGVTKNVNSSITADILNELNSEQCPVLLAMNSNAKLTTETKKYPNYKKANWDRFRHYINKNLVLSGGLKSIEDIDLEVCKIVGPIQNAIKKSVPSWFK